MPRGGGSAGRGGKRSQKGKNRKFTSADELAAQAEQLEQDKQRWRREKGLEDDVDGAAAATAEDKNSDSEEESSEEEEVYRKGVEHLIEIQNPNRVQKKSSRKVTELDNAEEESAKPELSRREREELQKQQAKANYMKMHLAGKTDEARADLARLAIIRKQREDATKKKEEEKRAKEALKNKKS